jgi:hypothetical protein
VEGGGAISIPRELGQAETAPDQVWAAALFVVAVDSAGRPLGVVALLSFHESEQPGADLDGQQGTPCGEDAVQEVQALLVSN